MGQRVVAGKGELVQTRAHAKLPAELFAATHEAGGLQVLALAAQGQTSACMIAKRFSCACSCLMLPRQPGADYPRLVFMRHAVPTW